MQDKGGILEVYLHPLRKPPKAKGDISRVLLILLLLCLVFIRHFMFIKHKDLWSSPPSLLPGEGKGSQQRPAAGDGDATCCRAWDILAWLCGGPHPQTQQSGSLGTLPVLKKSHGRATSLPGWLQTQGGPHWRSGTGRRGNAVQQGKPYQGHPGNTPKGGIRRWDTHRHPRATGQCSAGPRLSYFC